MNALRVASAIIGLGFAALGLLQIITGRVISVRRTQYSAERSRVEAGGWVGVAAGLLLGAAAVGGLLGGAVGNLLAAVWVVLVVCAGVWGAGGRIRRRKVTR